MSVLTGWARGVTRWEDSFVFFRMHGLRCMRAHRSRIRSWKYKCGAVPLNEVHQAWGAYVIVVRNCLVSLSACLSMTNAFLWFSRHVRMLLPSAGSSQCTHSDGRVRLDFQHVLHEPNNHTHSHSSRIQHRGELTHLSERSWTRPCFRVTGKGLGRSEPYKRPEMDIFVI